MIFPIALPNPQYPFERYNSKVLKIWLEQAAFVRAIRQREFLSDLSEDGNYRMQAYANMMEAEFKFQEISQVLEKRGYTDAYILQVKFKAIEDVES